jgi:hypothetical protein
MGPCSYEAYASARSTAAAELLETGSVGCPHGPGASSDRCGARLYVVLAMSDVQRRIPARSKAHICRSCRRCSSAAPRATPGGAGGRAPRSGNQLHA